ncbi:serine/threonine-protein kinase [Streptomyces sp. DK15]|uniref:protein kinase domain-containing protein n=1 Tax=Streptomyces sp. DK15 TaxID=2957499 RepID=UPI0029B0EED1|nr:protein kinase [Streptomyces sp. DK15]MDX2389818.1 serine/threonine-protein kinase [Streptomyces sp. DK15]
MTWSQGACAVRVGDELAGRYRLDERLGRGGMGEVWRGHDLSLDRSVAVKVLLEAATGDEVASRFRREATIGARLQHPGITVVHDVGRQDGRLFIVMELLSGEDLATVLARSPGGLPVATALDLAAQTAEALSAAHAQAVVHRDLKPGNLFLLPGGRLKICDFGIAHSSDATAGWTVTGRMFGTPAYMAPEQWRGERVDARCDLYALGCVLYALLSGEPPFGSAGSPYALMVRHIEEAPAALPVTPGPAALLATLLAKAPADRPASAAEAAAALRALERESGAGAPVAAAMGSAEAPAAVRAAGVRGGTAGAGVAEPGVGEGTAAGRAPGPGGGGAGPPAGPGVARPAAGGPSVGPAAGGRAGAAPSRTRDAAPPGEVLWRSRVRPQALHAAGDSVVWRAGPEVGSVWAATGAALWTARADEGVPATELSAVSAVSSAADTGAVYVAVSGRDGEGVRVLAREAGDGRVRWWRDLPEPPARTPVLTATGGLVLYGAGGGLTALDGASGETVWRYGVRGTISRRPTVSGNCLVLADGLLLTALHLPTGKPLWHWPRNTHRGGPGLPGGPVHVTDGKTVRALHRREGHVVWHFDAGTPAPTGMLSLDDTVHVAAHRAQEGWDTVSALDAESGAVRWRRPLVRRQGPDCAVELLGAGPDPRGVRGALGVRGLLYVKAADGGRGGLLGRTPRPPFLAALDLVTGELRWQWEHAGIGSTVRTGHGIAVALPELTAIAVP